MALFCKPLYAEAPHYKWGSYGWDKHNGMQRLVTQFELNLNFNSLRFVMQSSKKTIFNYFLALFLHLEPFHSFLPKIPPWQVSPSKLRNLDSRVTGIIIRTVVNLWLYPVKLLPGSNPNPLSPPTLGLESLRFQWHFSVSWTEILRNIWLENVFSNKSDTPLVCSNIIFKIFKQ